MKKYQRKRDKLLGLLLILIFFNVKISLASENITNEDSFSVPLRVLAVVFDPGASDLSPYNVGGAYFLKTLEEELNKSQPGEIRITDCFDMITAVPQSGIL